MTQTKQRFTSNDKQSRSRDFLLWEDLFGDYLKNTTLKQTEFRGKKNQWPFESSFVEQIPLYLFTPNKMTQQYKSNVQSFIDGDINPVECVNKISLPNHYAQRNVKTEPDQQDREDDVMAGAFFLQLAKQKRNKQHQSKISDALLKGIKQQHFQKKLSKFQVIKNAINQNIVENKKDKEKISKEKIRSLKFFRTFFDVGQQYIRKIEQKDFVKCSNLGDGYELKTSKKLNTAKLILDANNIDQKKPLAAKTIVLESKIQTKFGNEIQRKADQFINDLQEFYQIKEKMQSDKADKFIKYDQYNKNRAVRKEQYKQLYSKQYSCTDRTDLVDSIIMNDKQNTQEQSKSKTDRLNKKNQVFSPFLKNQNLQSDIDLYKYIHKKDFKHMSVNQKDYYQKIKSLSLINLIDENQNFHSESQKKKELNQINKKMVRRIGGGAFLKPKVNENHHFKDESIDIGHGQSDDESMISVNELNLNNLYNQSNLIQKQIKQNLANNHKENFHRTIKRFTHLENIQNKTIILNNLKLKKKS